MDAKLRTSQSIYFRRGIVVEVKVLDTDGSNEAAEIAQAGIIAAVCAASDRVREVDARVYANEIKAERKPLPCLPLPAQAYADNHRGFDTKLTMPVLEELPAPTLHLSGADIIRKHGEVPPLKLEPGSYEILGRLAAALKAANARPIRTDGITYGKPPPPPPRLHGLFDLLVISLVCGFVGWAVVVTLAKLWSVSRIFLGL